MGVSDAGSGGRQDGFLAELLRRYAEIVAVRLTASRRRMELTFLADGEMSAGQFMTLRTLLQRAMESLSHFSGNSVGQLHCRRASFGGYTQLTIARDIDTLSVQEVAVLVGLVRQVLGPRLVSDAPPSSPAGEAGEPVEAAETTLAERLEALKHRRLTGTLIGLRRSGRPLVVDLIGGPHAPGARPRHR